MVMLGQVAAVRRSTTTLAELHQAVSSAGQERLDSVASELDVGTASKRTPHGMRIALIVADLIGYLVSLPNDTTLVASTVVPFRPRRRAGHGVTTKEQL